MTPGASDTLRIHHRPPLDQATLVLAFTGWMDGGDVSTGTVRRLVDVLGAKPFADIDPEPYCIFNFPGSMELAALFRPHVKIEDGRISRLDMPENVFYCHEPANLVLFLGREPNLRWRGFGDAVLELARLTAVRRVLFVGSFGGSVPHTREPRLYVTCSDERLLPEMARYLQGRNPMSIEAVTRRLAKILRLPLDLGALRAESTEWELEVSRVVERDKDLAKTVRRLEKAYDDELLAQEGGES
jgi:PAC2 family